MMEKRKNQIMKEEWQECRTAVIITLMIGVAIATLNWWLFSPAMTIHSMFWIVHLLLLMVVECFVLAFEDAEALLSKAISLSVMIGTVWFMLMFVGSPLISARTYYQVRNEELKIEEKAFEQVMQIDDMQNLTLMSTKSAQVYGSRTLGTLKDETIVSQNQVSNDYYTVASDKGTMKISPLEYASVFKALKKQGIYGYVTVDTTDVEQASAKFVKTEPFKYAPSAVWHYDLKRTIHRSFPTAILSSSHMELDDKGDIQWITTVVKPQVGLWGCESVTGIIVTDPYTGESQQFGLDEIPSWVQRVYDGEYIATCYDQMSAYKKGFANSLFAQEGVTMVSVTSIKDEDGNDTSSEPNYGYVNIDGKLYIYTGITSANSEDDSNKGFILTDTVNGKTIRLTVDAESICSESGSMKAAEGEVANYGYKASFPSLVNLQGVPSYVLALTDDSYIIKRYAVVNVENSSVVAVAETLPKAISAYEDKLGLTVTTDPAETEAEEKKTDAKSETVTVTVAAKDTAVVNGNTYVYVLTTDGQLLSAKYADVMQNMIATQIGDQITITVNGSQFSF